MSIASSITPHLPLLRRFARSLTGRQESGDAYVVATIEALIADQSAFRTDVDPRVALYQVFCKLWNSIDANQKGEAIDQAMALPPVDRRLASITPIPRQAFLLVGVEGFSPGEAASILGVEAAQLQKDLDTAGREIAAQVATNVLIIEDEPLIAMDLEEIVSGLGHEVQGIARTKSEAIVEVERRKPGLILADIQLADGSSGLDTVRQVLGTISVPVIFITACPERALTGLRPEPTFLIAKPFQPSTIRTVISQALFFDVKPISKQAA